jgi:hypothetical protein
LLGANRAHGEIALMREAVATLEHSPDLLAAQAP